MQFAQISGAVQKLRPQFASLGMTVEETGMFTASYLTQQQHLGQLQNMSVRQQTQGAIQYNLELDKMARATGIQRKALDDANQQAMLDTKSRLALMNLEGPARSRFTARMTQLTSTGAGEIADVIKNLVATQGLVMPGMEKVVLAFRDAGVDITKITREISAGNANAIVELEQGIMKAGSIGKNLEGADRSLAGLGLVTGKTVPQQFLAMLAPLANGMGNVETAANDQKTAINDATKNLANFDGVILEARNKLSEALMPALDQMMNTAGSFVNLMGPDGPFLKAISSAATNVSDYINKFIEDAQSTDIIQAFQNLWNKLYSDSLPYVEKYWNELLAYSKAVILPKLSDLGDSLKKGIYDLFTNPTVVSALIGGIGLLLGGSLIKSAILGIPGSILDAGKSAKDAYKGAANPPGGGPVAPGAANRAAIGAGTTGLIKNLGKQALKFIPGVGLVMGAEEIGSTLLDSNLTSDQKTVNVAGTAGGMAGATAMGATGAALGTLAGPIGTVVGGLLGSIFGYFGGSYAGKSLAEKSVTGISNQKPTPPAAETPATKSAVESKPAMLEKTSAITDTNTQLAELNTTMTRVAVLLEDNNKLLRNVKTNTRATSGNLA
jgi:hypothetical protein